MATDDDSDVPETGGVFTFGKSKFADNVPSKFWVRNDPVAEVACGDEHTALVAESGRIFTFGANDWGQLGLGDGKTRTKPSCIKSLKSEKIRNVACGRSTTYVATESGRVYSCGGNSESQLGQGVNDASVNKPAVVEGLPSVKVKMLSAGADHVALLTEDGKLYVWGGGSEGQLGLGKEEECPTPKLLDVDEDVTCISCGYYHTAFTTESGALYTFGESENGKLGLGEDPENTNRPQKVSGIPGRVRMVACGGSHTIAVTTDGKVYSFGDGSNGQLGHGNIQLQATTPQEIMSLRDTKIHSASCGENHTALISFKGVLFTFGDGRHGKLGLGEENFANQFKPSAVTRFGAFTVERVACGGCHMLVLARPKVQNGEISASDSDEPVEEETKPMKQLELLRRSDDLDLSGSFSARNRRREKQDPSASMSRTLPPLNSSIGGRALPPLSSTIGSSNDNPLNKSMLPPLKKPGESSSEEKREESTESEENKLKKLEETEEDSESEPKRIAIKPATQNVAKASPVPRPRFGTKVKPAAKTDSEEESDSEDSKKKTEKPSFRKRESESEDEEDSKLKKQKEKKEAEKKNTKSRAKKRGGLFGKKNYLDSDEEEEKEESESESEESSEMEKRDKGKTKGEESEDDESDKRKNNINKKVPSKSEEDESSGDKEEEKSKEKDEDEESKPLVKKKSKLCVIL